MQTSAILFALDMNMLVKSAEQTSPRTLMDPSGFGEANHLSSDEPQARKFQVPSSEGSDSV